MDHMDDWYTFLFGGDESSRPLTLDASSSATSSKILVSKVNGRRFVAGNFSTPSLRQLRERGLRRLLQLRSSSSTSSSSSSSSASGGWSFQHIAVTDILEEHAKHPGALFQAASQFNCLEMPNWRATPEHGITGYQYDRTQGPSCALACAAGTVFRNDFVDLGILGQSAHRQLNCLDGVERALRNDLEHFFHVHNGYLFAGDADGEYKKRSPAPLQRLNNLLDKDDADAVMDALKIGLQTDTEVTFATRFRPPSGATTATTTTTTATTTPILVSQAYCSAVSVTDACRGGASEPADWRRFATLVLKAAYEATLWAAVLLALRQEEDDDEDNNNEKKAPKRCS